MIVLAAAGILVMALLGAPLFAVILAAAMLGFFVVDVDLAVTGIELYRITDTPLLVALPFFAFAGYVMSEAETSRRLMALTRALFGWMPAGLAIVGFVACAVFTALTGASGVTIVALGALLLPMLRDSGYSDRYSLGLVTTSGSLGLLIVPSVPLILYGIVAQQIGVGEPFTIQQLFLGRSRPGAADDRAAIGVDGVAPRRRRADAVPDAQTSGGTSSAARWELPLPVFVLGGIYSGFLRHLRGGGHDRALRDRGGGVPVPRSVAARSLPKIMRESMVMVGSIVLIPRRGARVPPTT